ncbi:MAG: DUF4381 domain-containing protein [Legionella sp.]|nr:DUF4381 domain-containing protein [Legionella sp.]
MDDKASLLNQLRDIHLPPPTSKWVLAPGWYVLLTLIMLLLLRLFYRYWQHHRRDRKKREALTLLKGYERIYQEKKDARLFSKQVSELLRRVALVYFPRAAVAGLYGKAWLAFLNQHVKGVDFSSVSEYLLLLPYQPSSFIKQGKERQDIESDIQIFYRCAHLWIVQRGRDV